MYNNENEKNLVKELEEAREDLQEIYDKTKGGDLKKALLSLSNRLYDAAAMLEEEMDMETELIRYTIRSGKQLEGSTLYDPSRWEGRTS